jgi:hypothetical protein
MKLYHVLGSMNFLLPEMQEIFVLDKTTSNSEFNFPSFMESLAN